MWPLSPYLLRKDETDGVKNEERLANQQRGLQAFLFTGVMLYCYYSQPISREGFSSGGRDKASVR